MYSSVPASSLSWIPSLHPSTPPSRPGYMSRCVAVNHLWSQSGLCEAEKRPERSLALKIWMVRITIGKKQTSSLNCATAVVLPLGFEPKCFQDKQGSWTLAVLQSDAGCTEAGLPQKVAIQSPTCSQRSNWSMIFGTGMEKAKISCTKTIGKDLRLNIFNIIWWRTMPFCEDSLFHERFNHARPAAAAAIWASEVTTSRGGSSRWRLSPRKARFCQANDLSSSLSSMPPSTQASPQLGWPYQMAMSNKVTWAYVSNVAPFSRQTATEKNCKSSPASSAARILSRDNFLPPSGPWGRSKEKPKSLSTFVGLQRSRRRESKWWISCQSSNLEFRNKACGKGISSLEARSWTTESSKSAPAHKAVLAAFQQHSPLSQLIRPS